MIKTVDESSTVDSIAYGGYDLSKYADETTEIGKMSISKIVSYDWDYVILQEHSILPCREPGKFFDTVKKLCNIISQTGAKVILYETWAYKDGSEKLASSGMSYDEMNAKLQEAYRRAAEENGAVIAPVGELFEHIYKSEHITHLINRDDNYHPSTSGSYLAACTIFKTVTGKTTVGLPCPPSVSLYNLSVIQRIADTI